MATDLEKFIELLKSWEVKYDLHTWGMPMIHEVSFDPDYEKPETKVIGDPWASCEFVFNEDGSFKNIEIGGD